MHNLGAAAGASSSSSSPSAVLSQLGHLSAPVAAGGVGGAPGAAGSSVGLGIMVGGVGCVAAGSSSGQLDREVLRKMMQVRGNVFSWTSTWGVGVEGDCCIGVRMKLCCT